MSKHFPVNPLEPVTEKKLCSEKISKISLYWCDNFEKISYDAIARAQIAFTAVQPLNELGLALCIFDELGCCAFASPHAPFESESSGGVIAAGSQQISLWFRTCLPPGRFALSFSLAERSDPSDDLAGWKVLCQQMHYLPFTILEGDPPPPPSGYAQIQTYSILESQIVVESLPENEALDHFPWSPSQYTLSDILATLDVTLPERIAAKAMAELPDTLQTQQLPLRLPANHARFHTVIGQRSLRGMTTTGKAGVLLYGPYMPAAPGAYEVVFDIRSSSEINEVIILDVVAEKGNQILGKTEWRVGCQQPAKITFEVPEQGVTDLECRVKVSKNADCSVEAITFFTTKQADFYRAYLNSESNKNYYLKKERVVLAINKDIGWLSLTLAVAKYLFDQRGWRTIFLMNDGFPGDDFFSGLDCSLGWIKFESYENSILSLSVKPDVLLSHSDNFDEIIEYVFEKIPNVDLICHADGFRNSSNGTKQVRLKKPKEVFYFGFEDFRNESRAESSARIILPSIYFDFSDAYIQSFFKRKIFPEKYSIFFLRYWGMHHYKFPLDSVVESWVSTVKRFLAKNELLILKESLQIKELTDAFISKLTELGYRVKFLGDYAKEMGFRPENYERMLRAGLLYSPSYSFVLDSSLPSVITALPHFDRKGKIVIGSSKKGELFKHFGWNNLVQKNVMQQIQCIKNNSNWQIIEFPDEPDLFLVESTKSDLNLATRGSIPHRPSFPPKYRQEQHWLTRHAEICAHSDKPAPQLLCFGDSLTQRLESHPDLLQQYLPYSILNAGFSGDRTEHLLWRLKDGEGKDLSPAAVLVWIGTNDIGQIQPTPPSEQVFCNIRAVCREVEARFPQAKKVLMGLLPRDASAVHPFRSVIKEANALLNTYAKEQGWHFMDAGERFVDEVGHLRMDYLPDGLHLNQAGYEVFLQALQPLINPQAIVN